LGRLQAAGARLPRPALGWRGLALSARQSSTARQERANGARGPALRPR